MIQMTKQTWRAERFRSADVRRSAHQRATESARKKRKKHQLTNEPTAKPIRGQDGRFDFEAVMIFLTLAAFAGLLFH